MAVPILVMVMALAVAMGTVDINVTAMLAGKELAVPSLWR